VELYTKLRHEFARVIAEKNGMPRRAARLATVTGFVDGTVFGVGARGDDTRFWVTKSQETGINYLGIQWPNGLMGAMMGPYEGHKGDSKAWVDSGLGEFMARHPDFKDAHCRGSRLVQVDGLLAEEGAITSIQDRGDLRMMLRCQHRG